MKRRCEETHPKDGMRDGCANRFARPRPEGVELYLAAEVHFHVVAHLMTGD